MGKRDRFEYTIKDLKGNVVFKGKAIDAAIYFDVVQNVIYMNWKNKSKLLGKYRVERKEVNPYIPTDIKRLEKAYHKVCKKLSEVCGMVDSTGKYETQKEWEEWGLKDD